MTEELTLTLRDGEKVRLVPAPESNGYILPDLFTFQVYIERDEDGPGWKASCLCVGTDKNGHAACGNHEVGDYHLHAELDDGGDPNEALLVLIEVLWYG